MFFLIFFTSCSQFLDIKPDQKISTIKTTDDLLALLSNSSIMNMGYSGLPEIASDNYFLSEQDWESLGFEEYRGSYIWQKIPMYNSHWNMQYTRIMYANVVIDEISNVIVERNIVNKNHIYGMALFFRAYTMMNLVDVFCPLYNKDASEQQLGLVLKNNSNINENKPRSSLLETLQFIENDLKEAAALLPSTPYEYPTRPYKVAALGALARLYLNMGDYENAEKYVTEALNYRSNTLDYSFIDQNKLRPFDQYNEDIVFFSTYAAQNILLMERAQVPEEIYQMFSDNDYRRKLYFSVEEDGRVFFKGNYQSSVNSEQFSGITVGELLLIKSELAAQRNDFNLTVSYLMKLLSKRYDTVPVIPHDQDALLRLVRDERQRELMFRGQRWGDLKRYAKKESFELTRIFSGITHKITSKELQNFCFLIPQEVIDRGNVIQNR